MLQQHLVQSITRLRAATPETRKGLTIIPIFGPDMGPPVGSLSQGIEGEQVQVREVSEHGTVSQLKVLNRSSQPTFIFDGEELVGGKQSRVVNTSILVPPNKDLVIPVSCCEAGRWARRNRSGFSPGPGTGSREMGSLHSPHPATVKIEKPTRDH